MTPAPRLSQLVMAHQACRVHVAEVATTQVDHLAAGREHTWAAFDLFMVFAVIVVLACARRIG